MSFCVCVCRVSLIQTQHTPQLSIVTACQYLRSLYLISSILFRDVFICSNLHTTASCRHTYFFYEHFSDGPRVHMYIHRSFSLCVLFRHNIPDRNVYLLPPNMLLPYLFNVNIHPFVCSFVSIYKVVCRVINIHYVLSANVSVCTFSAAQSEQECIWQSNAYFLHCQ